MAPKARKDKAGNITGYYDVIELGRGYIGL